MQREKTHENELMIFVDFKETNNSPLKIRRVKGKKNIITIDGEPVEQTLLAIFVRKIDITQMRNAAVSSQI